MKAMATPVRFLAPVAEDDTTLEGMIAYVSEDGSKDILSILEKSYI